MKQFLIAVLSGFVTLTACAPVATLTPVFSIQKSTATPSPIPTSINTSLPTETPTASITPLPTIPTFTPTFDVSKIVTVTSAPKAECPRLDSAIKIEGFLPEKLEYPAPNTTEKLLDFLNAGGNGQTLIAGLEQTYPVGGDYRGGYEFHDVTGDQSPEFLYVEINYGGKLLIFSCKDGKYGLLATLLEENDFLEYTMQLVNLNMNGIPEIIVMGTNGVSYPVSAIYFYEWNGKTFSNLGHADILALRQTKITDKDGNGIEEISFSGDNPVCTSCANFIPQRERTITYSWNGNELVEISNEFKPPKYRFQAIQDADIAVIVGNYRKAIQLYDEAISNSTLQWWSPERFTYEQHIGDPIMMFIETPLAIPTEDLTEYPRLAAYAYYRIMVLHFVQGNEQEASLAYETLQKKFGKDEYAKAYVEMANAFWNAYQSTHKMYDGCAAAIQYATEQPELLIPLGGNYHGSQSHTYVPADVCPFR